ncbi:MULTISPECIES: UvrY/SirA/GacA family response regulator transcription factor [Alteromonadaceae]|uniref:UvrY/SirA/GacA family response regulator transcription factor n=1 Tax=Alteromonadaceae TaxID=72275 RepID=UPI001C0920E7|nr:MULTISPECIES: UvrY/SirA/GacA family response regulator transcription factor [Aliiglaciecola]MBU2876395.1 UvrY/SirA/GacA family response regulator transcription factor [Aliiglaciecola lipolytica]MDO6710612.1 UvrY/SirA/GacA family response regulator transcription factor [Aliiglaciecola sp. 2_MG-2023]MDO6751523.1 UvrY/SirA/GacA family response regulator transcription factor [Aliiglaciecola sp. 1_MG-2023]
MIKLLLVDDHELVRTGIRRILEDVADFKVVGEVNNGEEAIKFCRNSPPDIVLMDMNMPGIGGLEATKQIIHYAQDSKVIVVSVHTENPIPARVMQLGAYGYITKGTEPQEMVIAIRKVSSGQRYIAPEIAQQIAIGQLNLNDTNPFDQLSRRELEITIMLTKGSRVPDIANKLNISAKTVNTYRYRMFEKLKVGSDVELTHLALRHNLIDSNQL